MAPSSYSDSSHSDSNLTPPGSTRPNSPAPRYTSMYENEPSAARVELWDCHLPSPEINASMHLAPAQTSPRPDEASLFKLQLVFCDTQSYGHAYAYKPNPHLGYEKNAKYPVVYLLDRKLSPEASKLDFLNFLMDCNPHVGDVVEYLKGKEVVGLAVNNPNGNVESEPPSIRVTYSGLIAQLRRIDTYGMAIVEPELFGTGGNELHILLRNFVKYKDRQTTNCT